MIALALLLLNTLGTWALCWLILKLNKIMSTVSQSLAAFAAAQKAFNDSQASGLQAVQDATTALGSDIQSLNDKITALQNNEGPISDQDQQVLDHLQGDGLALQTRMAGVTSALKALADANAAAPTPPAAPAPENAGAGQATTG